MRSTCATSPVRTLVLLERTEMVGSTITGVVDVNTIPQSLVQRVEVVNGRRVGRLLLPTPVRGRGSTFILDKKYTGLKVPGDIGITD